MVYVPDPDRRPRAPVLAIIALCVVSAGALAFACVTIGGALAGLALMIGP